MKLNQRELMKAMQRMGIQQQDIPATQVIIRQMDRDIVIENPQVAKVNMMGQETWQISGEWREVAHEKTPEINEEDIKTVMSQTGADREKALEAIKHAEGDLAKAILELSE